MAPAAHARSGSMTRRTLLVLVVASLLPTALADAPEAPASVFAFVGAEDALVVWDAVEGADGYRVYGKVGDGATMLATAGADSTHSLVAAGYETYGVSAVHAGVESVVVWGLATPCVTIDPTGSDPLSMVVVNPDCGAPNLRGSVEVGKP